MIENRITRFQCTNLICIIIVIIELIGVVTPQKLNISCSNSNKATMDLIKLDKWVVADLNTSFVVGNVSEVVTKLNNLSTQVMDTFKLFLTEAMAFQDVLCGAVNQTEKVRVAVNKLPPNEAISSIVVPLVDEFKQNVLSTVHSQQSVLLQYYEGVKFGTRACYDKFSHEIKYRINDVLSETDKTQGSFGYGQKVLHQVFDLVQEYFDQIENELLRESIATSNDRHELFDNVKNISRTFNETVAQPFVNCANGTVLCLQQINENFTTISRQVESGQIFAEFNVNFEHRKSRFISTLDELTSAQIHRLWETVQPFYAEIDNLQRNSGTGKVNFNLKSTITIAAIALYRVAHNN